MPKVDHRQQHLFLDVGAPCAHGEVLLGHARQWAQSVFSRAHYLHSVPSGKSHYFRYQDALIAFALPANPFVAQFLVGKAGTVWELARLWAPDGHHKNLLTQAIAYAVGALSRLEGHIDALVAYADPTIGHVGYVYRAASWLYTGQSEETRAYLDK